LIKLLVRSTIKKPEDNLDESIAESTRLLGLYDKIKENLKAQINKYKDFSGENIKEAVNPSFVLADPLSPEAHRLAKMNDLPAYIVDDFPTKEKVHDQTIDEIISERDVDKQAAALLTKADNSLGDLFTHDLGSPAEDLVGQEQEIENDVQSPYGPFEASIKYVSTLPTTTTAPPSQPQAASVAPSEDGVHIIPTTTEPESKQEVKITYVKNLQAKDEDSSMKLNGNLALGQSAVEADVTSQETTRAPLAGEITAAPPAPLPDAPEGLLRPIIVAHDLLHPTLQYK